MFAQAVGDFLRCDPGPEAVAAEQEAVVGVRSLDRDAEFAGEPRHGANVVEMAVGDEDLLERDRAAFEAALEDFSGEFREQWLRRMRAKLGLRDRDSRDQDLCADLLGRMHRNRADYTNVFRALCGLRQEDPAADAPIRDQFIERDAFDAWARDYRARLAAEQSRDGERAERMRAVNPKYVLRNYLAQAAIERAEVGDYGEIERLLSLLSRPFDEQPEMQDYAAPPPEWGRRIVVSCSS